MDPETMERYLQESENYLRDSAEYLREYGELEFFDPALAAWMDEESREVAPILIRPVDSRNDAVTYLTSHDLDAERIATETVRTAVQQQDLEQMLEDGVAEAVELERPVYISY